MLSKQIEVMSNGRKNNPILEDCFEAFIGCMMNYFGSTSKKEGFDKCYTFIISIIEKFIDLTELIIVDDNFKDRLMRFFHKKYEGKLPTYETKDIIQTTGHNGIINKKFHMCVKNINGKIIGQGISKSKKEAEQLAAKQALMYFGISNS
jgi:ribonuclease-3